MISTYSEDDGREEPRLQQVDAERLHAEPVGLALASVPEEEREDRDDDRADERQADGVRQVPLGDRLEGLLDRDDGLALGDAEQATAEHELPAEGDDEGRDAEVGDRRSLEEPDDAAGDQAQQDREDGG